MPALYTLATLMCRLPKQYSSLDTNRLTIAFFAVSGECQYSSELFTLPVQAWILLANWSLHRQTRSLNGFMDCKSLTLSAYQSVCLIHLCFCGRHWHWQARWHREGGAEAGFWGCPAAVAWYPSTTWLLLIILAAAHYPGHRELR